MDAVLARDEALKFKSRLPAQTWYEWFWGLAPNQPARPTDAALTPILRAHFTQMLDQTDPPESFKPGEVAQLLTNQELKTLGYKKWEEAVPAVYELAFEMREFGECVILRKGVPLSEEVNLQQLDGPVRIGRAE